MTTFPTKARPGWRFLFAHPAHLPALGFGSGLAPVAPGTFGTLAAFPLYWLLLCLPSDWLLPALLLGTLLGPWICGVAARNAHIDDPGFVVWDEIAAFWWLLYAAPATWSAWAAAFGLFRLFDAAKPWPIRWLDRRVKGGFGIMVDDLLAGAFALICLKGLGWIWPHVFG